MSDVEVSLHSLEKYYKEKVAMDKKDTSESVETVIGIVQFILKHIHKEDPRFSEKVIHSGSYWQGLKVKKADEFDFKVDLSNSTEPTNLAWGTGSIHDMYFGFNTDVDESALRTVPDHLDVVQKECPLPEPPTGYVKHASAWQGWTDLERLGYIVPFLVKKRFKELLVNAIDNPRLGHVKVRRFVNGPALTICIKKEGQPDISVDFAITYGNLSMPPLVHWPRPKTRNWLDDSKIEAVQSHPVFSVAKKPFYWLISYANQEKELISQIDKADGPILPSGCRKKCHRIMKSLNHEVWCPTTKPVITSYILKNVLFWECEEFPDSYCWTNKMLEKRLMNMTRRLLKFIEDRNVPHYFTLMNLLQDKDTNELFTASAKIKEFLQNPRISSCARY